VKSEEIGEGERERERESKETRRSRARIRMRREDQGPNRRTEEEGWIGASQGRPEIQGDTGCLIS
jgi:hypothetical protein